MECRSCRPQRVSKIGEPALVVVEHRDRGGIERTDLTHEFTADGSGGAGHQDPLTLEASAQGIHIDCDLCTVDEVLHGHVAEREPPYAASEQLVHGGP